MLRKHEANPQEDNHAEAQSQRSRFATLLKSHPRTDAPPRIRSTLPEYLSLREHLWGLLLYIKRVLEELYYKTLLFTVVKRNLLTLKNK